MNLVHFWPINVFTIVNFMLKYKQKIYIQLFFLIVGPSSLDPKLRKFSNNLPFFLAGAGHKCSRFLHLNAKIHRQINNESTDLTSKGENEKEGFAVNNLEESL